MHIYRFVEGGKLEFFASYNKDGVAPVNAKFDRIEALSQAAIDGSTVEVIREINRDDGQLLGYTYVRASADGLERLISRSVGIAVGVLLLSLLLCFLLTLKLQNTITAPIRNLAHLVQRISRHKDYSGRAQPSNIKELDILSDAFNAMMQRTQEHLQRQNEAEEE